MATRTEKLSHITRQIVLLAAIFGMPVVDAANLPGSVLPERAGSNLVPQVSSNPKALPALPTQKPKPGPNPLGPAANTIKFLLVRVQLVGNHVYTEKQLLPLYQNLLNKTITVAQLQGIVQDITNYYRNEGYILTRAVLPPQHVDKGIVTIQVIEGFVGKVNVVGIPKGSKDLVQAYGDHIAASRPLRLKVMEHYLLLANEIPGVQVKAVMEPSKTAVGASDLNLVAQAKPFSAYYSYDNYGTRYIGPLESSIGIEADSIFRAGDSTQFNGSAASRPQELKFIQLTHTTPLGTKGARIGISGNQALTRPGLNLAPEKIDGISNTFSATVSLPLLRSRTQNLTFDAALNYIDSMVTTLQESDQLYMDHLRTLRAGLSYDIADGWNGSNSAQAHLEHGFLVLGSTSIGQGNTPNLTSRFGASGHFTKANLQYSRVQQFGATRYSAFFQMTGQFTNEPLLATEQFGFGGVQQGLGRGYDSAEIIGDRGLAGSLELRMNVSPEKFYLQAAQLYAFYDTGVTWDLKTIADQKSKNSAASAGIGSRFFFTKNFSGNLLFAQPLTKQVAAQALIGDGRQPRVFFSLTASI